MLPIMQKLTVRDIDIRNKRILMRVDYNVPLDENSNITDDSRITKSLDTIHYCLSQNAALVLMSHLGRPKGKPEAKDSLKPAAVRLEKLLKKPVKLLSDCVGPEVEKAVAALKPGEIVMLENLRFHSEEEANDTGFSKKLAALGEVYVNDAFGTAHRAHASTVGVTQFLPSVAGFLLAKEIEYFEKAVSNPDRPFIAILGGAKVSDKIKLIKNLIDKADMILIGGAMAYTFYKVQGIGIGNSKFEPAGEPAAREALAKAKEKNFPLYFPVDRVMAQKLEKGAPTQVTDKDIPDGWSGFDIGPVTIAKYKELLSKAKMIVWNGPVGVFEIPPFDQGTRALANHIAGLKTTSIIGGGDTAAAVIQFGLEDKMTHISTGGGASLEYLEGTVLPGVKALRDKPLLKSASK